MTTNAQPQRSYAEISWYLNNVSLLTDLPIVADWQFFTYFYYGNSCFVSDSLLISQSPPSLPLSLSRSLSFSVFLVLSGLRLRLHLCLRAGQGPVQGHGCFPLRSAGAASQLGWPVGTRSLPRLREHGGGGATVLSTGLSRHRHRQRGAVPRWPAGRFVVSLRQGEVSGRESGHSSAVPLSW